MEMNDIYVNHAVVERSPDRKMKRTSSKPAEYGAAESSDDEMPDYENISVTADRKNHQPLAEMPPSDPAPTAPPTPKPAKGITREQKHSLILYLLMAFCFLVCLILLLLIVVKDQQMIVELKKINISLSHSISQVLEKLKKSR